MQEPGFDGRHRDKNPPKAGEIQHKRSDAKNGNRPQPIRQFRADATVGGMRKVTGETSLAGIRAAAERMWDKR